MLAPCIDSRPVCNRHQHEWESPTLHPRRRTHLRAAQVGRCRHISRFAALITPHRWRLCLCVSPDSLSIWKGSPAPYLGGLGMSSSLRRDLRGSRQALGCQPLPPEVADALEEEGQEEAGEAVEVPGEAAFT